MLIYANFHSKRYVCHNYSKDLLIDSSFLQPGVVVVWRLQHQEVSGDDGFFLYFIYKKALVLPALNIMCWHGVV